MSVAELRLPQARGRIVRHEALAPFTWLRVGGPADALFLPADEADNEEFDTELDTSAEFSSELKIRDATNAWGSARKILSSAGTYARLFVPS